jgi:hypothetical protein
VRLESRSTLKDWHTSTCVVSIISVADRDSYVTSGRTLFTVPHEFLLSKKKGFCTQWTRMFGNGHAGRPTSCKHSTAGGTVQIRPHTATANEHNDNNNSTSNAAWQCYAETLRQES